MRRRFVECRKAAWYLTAMSEFHPDRAMQSDRLRDEAKSWCNPTYYCDIPFCTLDGLPSFGHTGGCNLPFCGHIDLPCGCDGVDCAPG